MTGQTLTSGRGRALNPTASWMIVLSVAAVGLAHVK